MDVSPSLNLFCLGCAVVALTGGSLILMNKPEDHGEGSHGFLQLNNNLTMVLMHGVQPIFIYCSVHEIPHYSCYSVYAKLQSALV